MKKLITHSGKFHLDDIFACATLQLVLEKQGATYEVVRTRDPEVIASGDIVFDVGGSYDPSQNIFDHHQAEGAGMRENGIPYASFGLIWKHFGMDLCQTLEIFDEVDLTIASGVDAVDNGIQITENTYSKDVSLPDFKSLSASFMPSWKNSDTEEAFREGFDAMVAIAKGYLSRKIIRIADRIEAESLVEVAYDVALDKRIIVLDRYYAGKDRLAIHAEPLFVIYPNSEKTNWMVGTIQEDPENFKNRKDFPVAWGGLRDAEFAEATGVADAVFCHKNLFLMAARSRDGALELAKKALLM